MEFSELFSFFTIINDSFKLFPKIWKTILPITFISLIFPSLFFWLFSYEYLTFTHITVNPNFEFGVKYPLILLVSLLAAQIAFFAIFFVCSQLSLISTVIVSATAYATGHTLPLSDLLSYVKRTWRKPIRANFRVSKTLLIIIILSPVLVPFVVIADLINPVTIGFFIMLFIIVIIYEFISSAGKVLAYTVSIIEEENSDGSKAIERSEYLTEGQKLKGFMLNLFVNVIYDICWLIFWLMFRDQGSRNFMVYGLFFVNSITLLSVSLLVAYTVFYFQCKKLRGEMIDQVGVVLQYTKLPTTS